jgi:hypothetical protein
MSIHASGVLQVAGNVGLAIIDKGDRCSLDRIDVLAALRRSVEPYMLATQVNETVMIPSGGMTNPPLRQKPTDALPASMLPM